MSDYIYALILSVLPVSELRGGIPFALMKGYSPAAAYLGCVLANFLVGPAVFIFLNSLHGLLYRIRVYRIMFNSFEKRVRKRTASLIRRYGFLGVALFVAIPLPVTGAYTGSLAAWLFDLDWKRSMLAVMLGVMTAGVVVLLVILLGIECLKPLFVKTIP